METLIVVNRKMELYVDMIINLTYKIYNTHPGYDSLDEKDMWNHFIWCFKNIVKDFLELEDIDLTDEEISLTLFSFFYNELYKLNEEKPITYYLTIWRNAFNSNNGKVVDYIYNIYIKFEKIVKHKFDIVQDSLYIC